MPRCISPISHSLGVVTSHFDGRWQPVPDPEADRSIHPLFTCDLNISHLSRALHVLNVFRYVGWTRFLPCRFCILSPLPIGAHSGTVLVLPNPRSLLMVLGLHLGFFPLCASFGSSSWGISNTVCDYNMSWSYRQRLGITLRLIRKMLEPWVYNLIMPKIARKARSSDHLLEINASANMVDFTTPHAC